jgi:mannitol/fructose-specific phosphotransferase system IIA component (Ntr-type)
MRYFMAGIRISEIFKSDRIALGIKATDKYEVFEVLADLFAGSCGLGNRDEILKLIRERENKMSTGIGNGIAVPHARLSGIHSICGALGVSNQGIEYDALDDEPVYIVFLFISGIESSDEHLELMKNLMKLASNPSFIGELKASKNPEAAHRIIMKYETINE